MGCQLDYKPRWFTTCESLHEEIALGFAYGAVFLVLVVGGIGIAWLLGKAILGAF